MTESPETLTAPTDDEPTAAADESAPPAATGRPPKGPAPDLEKESEIAADYLEELLDIADLDGDIDMDVEHDRAAVSVVGGDLDDLVGREGVVLEALQELTRLAVLTADRAAQPADAGHRRVPGRTPGGAVRARDGDRGEGQGHRRAGPPRADEPLRAQDRARRGRGRRAASESEGEEPNRRVVVLPA